MDHYQSVHTTSMEHPAASMQASIHAASVHHPCTIHRASMQLACSIHAAPCSIHAASTWHPSSIHTACDILKHPCSIPPGPMEHSCSLHKTSMRNPHGIHTTLARCCRHILFLHPLCLPVRVSACWCKCVFTIICVATPQSGCYPTLTAAHRPISLHAAG